ncbi:MAG: murein transglycosylase A, partial [Hyphococcus sp.]
ATLDWRRASFDDLAGWRVHDPSAAFEAFLISCARIHEAEPEAPFNQLESLSAAPDGRSLSGAAGPWRNACLAAHAAEAAMAPENTSNADALRAFFESHFTPMRILARSEPVPDDAVRRAAPKIEETGVFTGYYEPAYPASRQRTDALSAPLYARPDNLIEVDLGAFREEFTGERIAGRVEGGRLVPYPDHREINDGALDGAAEPLAWLDPNDLLFLQIQGSGQLLFEDGARMRVGYAGQNGHPYTAVGRVLVERGVMPLADASMQSIRQWLNSASAQDARSLREENASYVFFRELSELGDDQGPLGAQGLPLTPGVSLAVDRRFHALGAPVWVDIDPTPENGPERIRRLMIAQDTGGAIRGPIRGDVFWGSGPRAEAVAGRMKAEGRMYVLAPNAAVASLAAPSAR